MSDLDATIGAGSVDPGWWGDPKIWLIVAISLIVIVIVGIYMKALIEHQGFNLRR